MELKTVRVKNRRWAAVFLAGGLLFLAPTLPAAEMNRVIHNAMKLYEKGNYDKALKQFIKVLKSDPNNSMAREYMLLCSQKIVETKLGPSTAETVEKKINVAKQLQEINTAEPSPLTGAGLGIPGADSDLSAKKDVLSPLEAIFAKAAEASPPPPVDDVVDNVPEPDAAPISELPGMEAATTAPAPTPAGLDAAAPGTALAAPAASASAAPAPTSSPSSPTNAQDILRHRQGLADDLRRRHLGTENIVQLEAHRGHLEVNLFLDRLFLPLSDILRDDAYVILDHVIFEIRRDVKRRVSFKAVDTTSPAVRSSLPQLTSKRCTVVFSYLLYRSLEQKGPTARP